MKEKKEELFGFIETLLICMFVMSIIFSYVLRITEVDGDSMNRTLDSGDRLIVTRLYGKPECGDIVVINAEESLLLDDNGELVRGEGAGMTIIKRVIATEGQTVDIDFPLGRVYVDGEQLKEDYITGLTHIDDGSFTGKYPVTVPEGCVFVMGDNRMNSRDSRWDMIGFVSEEDIIGKAVMRVYPIGKIGFLKS